MLNVRVAAAVFYLRQDSVGLFKHRSLTWAYYSTQPLETPKFEPRSETCGSADRAGCLQSDRLRRRSSPRPETANVQKRKALHFQSLHFIKVDFTSLRPPH